MKARWQPEKADAADQWTTVYCDVPKTTLSEHAQSASTRLQVKTLRMVGDPNQSITPVAVIHGFSYPTTVLSHALQDPAVDCIVTGNTPEVDHCTTYIRDAITAGRNISLAQVGYDKSDYRVIGDPSTNIKRVGIGAHKLVEILKPLQTCDVVQMSELQDCDAFPYLRDAIALGVPRPKSLIAITHERIEEWGEDSAPAWLKPLVPEVPIEFISAGDPYWTLSEDRV